MPELPEVETVRRALEPGLVGKRVLGARVFLARIFEGGPPGRIGRELAGLSIRAVRRRGKYLLFDIPPGLLVIHLGMSGRLYLRKAEEADKGERHLRFFLSLEGGESLAFINPRTFGRVIFIPEGDGSTHPRLRRLGLEPLDLRLPAFLKSPEFRRGAGRRSPVKALLLNQSWLCGCGNIYADEALFDARIHPQRRADELSEGEWKRLLGSLCKVLRRGLGNAGTTFNSFRRPDGSEGRNREALRVYGRGGEACLSCRSPLKKTRVAGRGTVFCPCCQPAARGVENLD